MYGRKALKVNNIKRKTTQKNCNKSGYNCVIVMVLVNSFSSQSVLSVFAVLKLWPRQKF